MAFARQKLTGNHSVGELGAGKIWNILLSSLAGMLRCLFSGVSVRMRPADYGVRPQTFACKSRLPSPNRLCESKVVDIV